MAKNELYGYIDINLKISETRFIYFFLYIQERLLFR